MPRAAVSVVARAGFALSVQLAKALGLTGALALGVALGDQGLPALELGDRSVDQAGDHQQARTMASVAAMPPPYSRLPPVTGGQSAAPPTPPRNDEALAAGRTRPPALTTVHEPGDRAGPGRG